MKFPQKKVFKDSDSEGEDVKPTVSAAVDETEKGFPTRGYVRQRGPAASGKTERSSSQKGYFRDAKRRGWRLIIRNLPFKTKKEDLQVICSKQGPFTEIVLPKCKDPRYPDSCAGFAFVQFKDKKDAQNALNQLNLSEVHGRKVAVDWAVAKDTYETAHHEEKEQEKTANIKTEVKEEPVDNGDEGKKDENARPGEDSSDSDEEEEENEESDDDEKEKKIGAKGKKKSVVRERREDSAVSEGRVVFVRNLSYDTSDDALKEAVQKFGEIGLAIICRYADSEHSKGTGFVHFKSREDADSCISAIQTDPGIIIDGRRIYGHRAIPKAEATALEKDHLEKKPKDKRNLHLLRVGVIRAGTATARGMSELDEQKRSKLALAARAKLRNLHMFVSPTRLVVHNLPLSLTDKGFKTICFVAAGNPDAKIIECRIWRDKGRLDAQGVARSTGFGFVAFSEHADALACLRQLNNNPETFTNEKRPIVEFSIENLSALRLRENRLKGSKNEPADGKKASTEKSARELERTKREMAAGGQKPLPSHLGPKIRHRDLQQKGKSTKSKLHEGKGKKRKVPADAKQIVPTKKPKKQSKSKQLTKFLAFSS